MFKFSSLNVFRNEIWAFFALIVLLNFISAFGESPKLYTNEFAVYLNGGDEEAESIARQNNLINRGQIGSLKGYYLFESHRLAKRSLDYAHDHHAALETDKRILWVEQQHAKRRVKRELSFSHVTDPLYSQQWYLSHGARDGYDMNVLPAWEAGYTGKGVVVTILDDGIQTNHPDLIQNYDPLASTDINGNDDDPSPQDDNKNKHGTRCAGEVAATAFNEFCGIGIAFNASIGGVRMLDGTVTDEVEARALSLNRDHIHIYSASWGPEDDGKTVDGPGRLAKQAFIEGIQQGRGGKGSIFVWASGNGGRFKDNCNCDGYTNSIYTLSISSATQEGQKPWYLEECSSTLASTYSSGTFGQDLSVVTVDMDTSYFKQLGKNKNPDISRLCTKSHTGTSASAPLAAGICALALEANPNLTWRDMQHLTVMTSRPQPLLHVEGWSTNGVGRHFSHKFGYGMMDAAAMVNLAKSWSTVPPQVVCRTQVFSDHWVIQPHTPLEVSINTDGCRDTTSEVNFLEHVQVVLSLNFHPRGSLHIQLVSPSGTRSSLLLPRPYDTDQHALTDWPFLSVHFWGEAPQGTWTLVVANEGSHLSLTSGTLFQWALVFYGTKDFPVRSSNHSSHHDIREATQVSECAKQKQYEYRGLCQMACPSGYYADTVLWTCEKCNNACKTCYGPLANQCLTCPDSTYLHKEICTPECPEGYFGDLNLRECLECDPACSNCTRNARNCRGCRPGYFLWATVCEQRCGTHHYPDATNNLCKMCDNSCLECALSPSHCTSCPENKYLVDNQCQEKCPPQHFPNEAKFCEKCKLGCNKCQGPSGHCLSCEPGWQLTTQGTPTCEPLCSDPSCTCQVEHCQRCADQSSCARCQPDWQEHGGGCVWHCPKGWYSQDGRCRPCSPTCDLCHSADNCEMCREGMVVQQGSCLTSCSPQWFHQQGSQKCERCDASCAECSLVATNCTQCPHNTHLLAGQGQCVTRCPAGHYENSLKMCQPCHHHCQECNGPTSASCTSCQPDSRLSNGMCLPCPLHYYLQPGIEVCKLCHESCARCFGPGADQCLECGGERGLDLKGHSCLPCCGSPQASGRSCCQCSPDHKQCLVPGSTDSFTYVVVGACLLSVLVFFLLFGGLQAHSHGWCQPRYRLLTAAKFDPAAERVSLTHDAAAEEEEELEENGTLPRV